MGVRSHSLKADLCLSCLGNPSRCLVFFSSNCGFKRTEMEGTKDTAEHLPDSLNATAG